MHKIFIRAIGKPQEPWQKEAIQLYLERLRPFAKLELIELPEGHQNSAKPDEVKTKKHEAEALLKNLPPDSIMIALDETGKNLPSPDFAKKIEEWTHGGRIIIFFIGGSWGLDASVREKADLILSFGKHTLPHLFARLTLLEQLYRAETILAGKMYHK